ncbi:hypothetical protein B0H13DRAFT_1879681 [Mycena leptocephala]|nr:hypothetical protein B0H13DRAFT_1879681 [Mycena leptocephala]
MISGPGSTSKINVDPTSSTLHAVGSGGRDARKRELTKAHRAVPNGAQETWRCAPPVRTEYWQGGVKPWLNSRSRVNSEIWLVFRSRFSAVEPLFLNSACLPFETGEGFWGVWRTSFLALPVSARFLNGTTAVIHPPPESEPENRSTVNHKESLCDLGPRKLGKWSASGSRRIRDRVLAVVGVFSGCCFVLEHTNDQATPHILHAGCRSPHAIDDS